MENKQSSEMIEVEDINHVVPLQDEATILISQAIEKNVPVETMEKLLAMRRELRAEKAKEAYDKAMAAFQAECPMIEKTKAVKTSGGTVAYKYAPIESIVDQVKEPLKNNGFSYSTNMVLLPTGVKVLVKVTHAAGHSEVTEMEVPLGNKTNVMSQTQVVAAATTFAKRYAFTNAFGIMTGDEDDDATSVPKTQPVQKQESTENIKPITMTQKEIIRGLMDKKGKTVEDVNASVKSAFKVNNYQLLTMVQAYTLIKRMQSLPDNEEEVIEDDIVEDAAEALD